MFYDWLYGGVVTLSGSGNNTATFIRTSPMVFALSVRASDEQYAAVGGNQLSGYTTQNISFTNRAPAEPIISCVAAPVPTGDFIVCTAVDQGDPDGGAVSYVWNNDGATTISGSNNNTVTLTRATPMSVTLRVRARDGQSGAPGGEGFSTERVRTVSFTNRPPAIPTVTASKTNLLVGEVFTWIVSTAGDPEGEAFNMQAWIYDSGWQLIWNNGGGVTAGGGPRTLTYAPGVAISVPGTYYLVGGVLDAYMSQWLQGPSLELTVVANGPVGVSGPSLWYDAEVADTNANGRVLSWQDRTGSGQHAVATSTSASPRLVQNVRNGRPALEFALANSVGMCMGNRSYGRNYTIFAVHSPARNGSWGSLSSPGRLMQSRDINWLTGNWAGTVSHFALVDFVSLTPPSFGIQNVAGAWYQTTATSSGTDGLGRFFIGGVNRTERNINTVAPQRLGLGSCGEYPAEVFDGYVAEVIVYPRVLTQAERQSVEAYLSARWSTMVP